MTDMEVLHQMIKPTAQIKVTQSHGKIMVELIEPKQPDSSVKLSGLPEDVMIIKGDAFKSPDSVFNCSNGECKRADFIVIAKIKTKIVIIYIEMKKTKGQENEIVQQLHGARCFVSYCREVGRAFFHQPAFLNNCIERFVSIGFTRINKGRTQTTRTASTHDQPERMLKISRPFRIEFNHLAGVNR